MTDTSATTSSSIHIYTSTSAQKIRTMVPTRSPVGTIIVVALGILLLGSVLMSHFIDQDVVLDEQAWKDKLSIISESKSQSLERWLRAEQSELQMVASNPSLQLYLSQLITARGNVSNSSSMPAANIPTQPKTSLAADIPANSSPYIFIHNLLKFSAERLEYFTASPTADIGVSLPNHQSLTGMMVTDVNHNMLVSTVDMASVNQTMYDQLSKMSATSGVSSIIQSGDRLMMGFSEPILAVQGDSKTPIGYLIGIKYVDQELKQLFSYASGIDARIQLAMVKSDSGNIDAITFSKASQDLLKVVSQENSPETNAHALALSQLGNWFKSKDSKNHSIYVVGFKAENTPWAVTASVPEDYAMATSKQRRQTMFTMLIAFSVVMAMLIVAISLLASSKRAMNTSRHFRALAKHSHMQEAVLKAVANAQPETLFLIDSNFRFRYANYHAAKSTNTSLDNLIGKTVSDVMGQAKAQAITGLATDAMNSNLTQTLMLSVQKDNKEHTILRTFIPITSMGVQGDENHDEPHVLITDRDITDVTEAREKRLKLNAELVELLVALMDQRDQHATNHSRHVADLASAIAKNMGLSDIAQTHVFQAGLLMNVGKMVVPERWLNSNELLDEKSVQSIRHSLKASSQILNKLDFDDQVIEALKQAHEYMDGSGALGLKGESICVEGRIITVANACISMLSPRAYREAMSWEQVAKSLSAEAGSKYDRGVIGALVNYMENMGGKKDLKITKHAA